MRENSLPMSRHRGYLISRGILNYFRKIFPRFKIKSRNVKHELDRQRRCHKFRSLWFSAERLGEGERGGQFFLKDDV